MAAKTVGYSQGASGQHVLTVIQKLGIGWGYRIEKNAGT